MAKFKMNDIVKVSCLGKTKTMTRGEALNYFSMTLDYAEPGTDEYDRYERVVNRLESGQSNVNDNW